MKENKIKKKILYKIWLIGEWIDININHGIIETALDNLPKNKFSYDIWKNICYKPCQWWTITVYNSWFRKGE